MSLRSNDNVFEKVHETVEQYKEKSDLINRIENILIKENVKSYSVNYEYYNKYKYITIQWIDYHNKYNMTAIPLNKLNNKGVYYEKSK